MTSRTESSIRAIAPARHSAATTRALDASHELVDLLKGCEKAISRAKGAVDEEGLEIVARISQSLSDAAEAAKVLHHRVRESAHERSGFWEPATDPDYSVRMSLARRVRNSG